MWTKPVKWALAGGEVVTGSSPTLGGAEVPLVVNFTGSE